MNATSATARTCRRSRPAARRAVLALLVLVVAGPTVWVLDHVQSRPDRIQCARNADDLLSVQDALLHYEYERGVLPARLQEITPLYLRPDQLLAAGAERYRYDCGRRSVGLAAPIRICGLWPRYHTIADRLLPPPPPPPPVQTGTPRSEGSGLALFVPAGTEGGDPPPGALVFEAEHYSETTYGWEVHPDPACGGGAYLHTKEGMGNAPGQIVEKIYDFYDIREGTEYSRVKFHIRVALPGKYFIYCRLWTTGSHCSNSSILGLDVEDPKPGDTIAYNGWTLSNQTPFRWVWTRVEGGPVAIGAGDHYIHLYPHEDGIRYDQFMLSPTPIVGDAVYRANLQPNAGTAFAAADGPPVHLTFDLKSMVMTPGLPPECRLVVRRRRAASGGAVVHLTLRAAGPDGADLRLGVVRVDLAMLPELSFLPIDFGTLDLARLPRREYLLTAELVQAEKTLAQCRVPLMRPFAWEVSPMLPYVTNTERGPRDADAAPADGGTPAAWTPFADSNWDTFGVMDFGLQTTGNSLNAPETVTLYAQTRISVPKADQYLLKLQSDDQMILWLDGKEICRNDNQAPVTRSVVRLPLQLGQGEHRLRIRVNQRQFSTYGDGRWQASVRFRTRDDLLSDIVGLPPTADCPD